MSRTRRELRLTHERANHGARHAEACAKTGRNHEMKYMLMMHAPRGTGDWSVFNWPPEDLKAHINFMKRFGKELKDAGELVGAEGLAPPDQAKVVRAKMGGGPEVTDGPFPEAKEFLAGYWIVD